MILLELFLAFLEIGACAIGGGYATIPLIQSTVLEHGWLTTQEFQDIITISQMTPGPLAVNTSTFVGLRVSGFGGALIATLGCVIIGVILCIALNRFFLRFAAFPYVKEALFSLRASSTGLICSAAITILCSALFLTNGQVSAPSLFICVISFFLLRKTKWNTILILLLGGALGIVCYVL